MLVYVLNKHGDPFMPCKPRKARMLLKEKKAKVVEAFAIYNSAIIWLSGYTQNVSLGVDAGTKHIGLSATTEKKVLFEADVLLRTDIVQLLSSRRELRSAKKSKDTPPQTPIFKSKKAQRMVSAICST